MSNNEATFFHNGRQLKVKLREMQIIWGRVLIAEYQPASQDPLQKAATAALLRTVRIQRGRLRVKHTRGGAPGAQLRFGF